MRMMQEAASLVVVTRGHVAVAVRFSCILFCCLSVLLFTMSEELVFSTENESDLKEWQASNSLRVKPGVYLCNRYFVCGLIGDYLPGLYL